MTKRLRCADHPEPDLWFATRSELLEVSTAQMICAGCPAREDCFRGAIARREPAGIWGGVLFDNGRPVQPRLCVLPKPEMPDPGPATRRLSKAS